MIEVSFVRKEKEKLIAKDFQSNSSENLKAKQPAILS
jgi:hypothetical protein